MAKSQINYIEYETDWFEEKVKGMMALVDANFPFSDIPDRTETDVNAKGVPIIRLIAKKEEMIKVMKDILKDLPAMLDALNKLREKKAVSKMETRGGKKIPGMMNRFLEERGDT